MRKTVILTVLLLFMAAWWSAISESAAKPLQYNQSMKKATAYEEKGIYYDAILEYQKALELKPDNKGIYLKMANDYLQLGDKSSFEETCQRAISIEGEKGDEAALLLTDYYLNNNNKEEAIALLKRQIEKKKNNGNLKAKLQSLAGGFQIVGGEYEEISDSCSGYMYVKADGKYGMIGADTSVVIQPEYDALGLFGQNGFAPVSKEQTWFYIDNNDYKRRVPDDNYDYMGVLNQNVLPAEKDGKFGYLNEAFEPLTEFIYDGATPMMNGIAAVKQNEKWALVDENLKPITEFGFDEIAVDDWGFCSRNSVVFAKTGEAYVLLNQNGVQIGKETYEDVRCFTSEQPAAVMQAGKWGFIDVKGNKVLECMYSKARSFSSIGYAPVYKGGSWGYIRQNGDFVVEPQFEEAKAFNSQGIAPVYTGGTWKMIQLDIF